MKFNEDIVPINLEECLSIIKSSLTPEDIAEIQRSTSNPCQVHFNFGMYLRNSWSIWEKNTPLRNWFKNEYDIEHPDDISGIIMDCLWQDIRNKPRKDKQLTESYKNYWKKIEENPNGEMTLKIDNNGNIEIL